MEFKVPFGLRAHKFSEEEVATTVALMRGEVPLAFVELIEGVQADPVEIRQFCRGSLSGFKVPREVRIVEALPRNPTGKIQRRRLSADTPGREEPTHAES